ncbi:hypothetical protein [Clostridium botulinum]|uniref:DNA replication protein DnaD n=1 Tax=Clostridium botulinum TaxID=1491 RepID=A0A846I4Q1_CLOBO|nr:hypothetical protein [Clostridium botulinum]AJE09621.1 putative phage protein [Clostridium botulinum CDC_1436]NEZ93079.1 DNA replication protein DnaD [Clostridium botulinum]NFB30645.1 DNA replication protein DnaD [Clostridium botulinum]RFM22524.1 DNA replication protein DnaD [Clostridium botulinum]
MAYRLVYTEFWTDPKVLEEMTPEDRYFYLYLLTNPCTTNCGIYQITRKQMAFEIGHSTESINSLMDRFTNHHKLIMYNTETRELAIKNWGKYNLNKGGKPVLDCLTKELKEVKDKSLIKYVGENVKSEDLRQLYQSFIDMVKSHERDVPRKENDTVTSRGRIVPRQVDDTKASTNGEKQILRIYQGFNDTVTNRERVVPRQGDNTTTNTSTKKSSYSGKSNIDVFKHLEKCNFIMSTMLMEKIAADIEIYGHSEVMKAAEISDENSKHSYNYLKGVLENRRRGEVKGGNSKQSIKELEREGLGFSV